jgi:hypothetical protein|uniref:J domain-containing protein n=1 Tax=viral metagenome TaxID=1070528 RepID=A0A6C0IUH9_9ZZZZ
MESKNFEDLYKVLNVDFGSSKKDILKNYKDNIKYYQEKILNGTHLDEEERWNVKLLKIAKFVLSSDALRKKYDISQIIIDSDESPTDKQKLEHDVNSTKQDQSNQYTANKYTEINKFDIPLRKDKPINLKEIGDRQFERYDHKNFDLSKDRELRGSIGGI